MSVSLENFVPSQPSISNHHTDAQNQVFDVEGDHISDQQFVCGDVFSGKISSVQGNMAELLLSDGQTILAFLNEDVQIPVGEQVLFSIKGMKDHRIEITPLFENTAKKSMVIKALENAGLKENEQNIVMVQKMMERGMSVQKEAIFSMKKSITQFPHAKIEDVVDLQNMKIPVTSENLSQLSMYKNEQNEIIKPVAEMLDKIPQVFDKLMENGEMDQGVRLYSDLVILLSEAAEEMGEETDIFENKVESEETGTDVRNNFEVREQTAKSETNETVFEMKDFLVQLGLDEEQAGKILLEKHSMREILSIIKKQVHKYADPENNTINREKLADIFKNPVFKKFMQKAGRELSELAPKDVKDFENIEKLYENIRKRAGKVLEILSEREEFSITAAARNLKDNLDFMNQLNQMYQYVQIPLKFSQSHTTGELYVYGNGKKLSLEDGNVSALLHLSMEHLGTVDIHVEMDKQKQVKTNFYLEDENVLDFLYAHINVLNERLENRGYSPVSNVCMRNKSTKTPMETILKNGKNIPVLLDRQSFDTRI